MLSCEMCVISPNVLTVVSLVRKMREVSKKDEVQWEGDEIVQEREVGGDEEEEPSHKEGCWNLTRIAGQVSIQYVASFRVS